MPKNILIAYSTLSGNTEEVAELIESELTAAGNKVTLYRIGMGSLPTVNEYDAMFIGSYTWDKGTTPEETKDFVADVGFKPENVFVFGTGDTQFGGDALFCLAVDKLSRFYHSRVEGLKIEQSPRGTQGEKVIKWTRGVLEDECFKTSESIGAN